MENSKDRPAAAFGNRRQQETPPPPPAGGPLCTTPSAAPQSLFRGLTLEELKRNTTDRRSLVDLVRERTLSSAGSGAAARKSSRNPGKEKNSPLAPADVVRSMKLENKVQESERSLQEKRKGEKKLRQRLSSSPFTSPSFTFSSPPSGTLSSQSSGRRRRRLGTLKNPFDLTENGHSPLPQTSFTFSSPTPFATLDSSSLLEETQRGATAAFPVEIASSAPQSPAALNYDHRPKAVPSSCSEMVTEREPPKVPLSPSKSNLPTAQPEAQPSPQPEFGKPTLLGVHNKPNSNPFNVPRPNQSRPEHHRSKPSYNPLQRAAADIGPVSVDPSRAAKPESSTLAYPTLSSNDPFYAPRPPAQGSVPIARPTNPLWTTKPVPQPTFSSAPVPIAGFNSHSYAAPRNFVDLTTRTISVATNADLFDEGFGAADPYTYIDAAKANENIKSLLEGAIEDEDEKPRTRLRKKKLADEANDLADKLKDLGVGTKDGKRKDDDEEEEEDDGTVEGLKVKLLPHQIDGVNWMRDKETGTKKTKGTLPKGGILADDMGLGKTIQSIALILTNPKPASSEVGNDKDKSKRKLPPGLDKGTLVVAPLALIKQWEAEINDKVEDSHRLRVCVHHGPQRAKHAAELKKYDVVITTYQILVSEHGASKGTEKVGCFGVYWYRVILDEAHSIKNRNAKATQAAYALRSEYRWCLTGTPMQNNLDELQSLIKFLRIKEFENLAYWREKITKPMANGQGGLAIKRLQILLKVFMKRRTKEVLKQGGALKTGASTQPKDGQSNSFQITKRQVEKLEAEFTPEERRFYKRLEDRTDKSLEQMMAGQKMSYASALVLLLRLRQACNHPKLVKTDLSAEKDGMMNLVQSPSKKVAKEEDMDNITDMLGGLSVATKRCDVCQIELSAKEASSGAIRCAECEADLEDEDIQPKKIKKEKKKKLKQNESTKVKSESSRERSGKNRRVVLDSDEEEDEKGDWLNSGDEGKPTRLGKAGGAADEDAEGGGEWLRSESDEISDGEDEEDTEEEDSSEELSHEEREQMKSLIVSTKIRHLLEILNRESGKYKFIIFSFFTSMLDLIEPFLKRDGLVYTRYDGAMRNDLREASLNRLRTSSKTRILLCSLRAGSLGLNLTAASRVVILEPFWNPFVEEQAIDRVHRLNQTLDVVVYKMTIKDTVEERILDLQERKRELANSTIEGKSAAGKLALKDMLALFRHDAGHTHRVDGIGVGSASNGSRLLGENRDGRGYTPPLSTGQEQQRPAGRQPGYAPPRRPEDPLFGRRW